MVVTGPEKKRLPLSAGETLDREFPWVSVFFAGGFLMFRLSTPDSSIGVNSGRKSSIIAPMMIK